MGSTASNAQIMAEKNHTLVAFAWKELRYWYLFNAKKIISNYSSVGTV